MAKRARKPNFKTEELDILADEVDTNKIILLGKLSDVTTCEKKKKVWTQITAKINANCGNTRTIDEVRKKWQDWSSNVKGKRCSEIRERKKTGGGEVDLEDTKLSQVEMKVVGIMGPTAISGVSGGTDCFEVACTQAKGKEQEHLNLNIDERLVQSDIDLTCYDSDVNVNSDNDENNDMNEQLTTIEKEQIIDKQLKRFISREEKKRESMTQDIKKRGTKEKGEAETFITIPMKKRTIKSVVFEDNEASCQNDMPDDILTIEKDRLKIEKND